MEKRLERSLNLLEDVSRGMPSHSKLLRLGEDGSPADISNSSIFFNTSMMPTKRKQTKYTKSDFQNLSLSIAMNQSEASFDQSHTTRFIDEPTCVEGLSLNRQFQEVLEMHSDSHTVFDAILNFIDVLNRTISSEMAAKDNTTMYAPEKNDIASLVNERNTWLLIHALYKDRDLGRGGDSYGSDNYSCPMSEKEIMDNLYKQDSSIRESQMVVDWLERVAREESGDYPRVAHFTDPTVAWENTLHQMQNTTLPYAASRQLVSSLDPDAPARENKHLHDVDHDDQYRLLTEVFKEIRMGRLDKAEELCLHCGQAWLAAALEGWRLYHDPNRDHTQAARGTLVEGEGNHERGVWKWVAWSICEGDGRGHVDTQDALERAVYGALCGHLDSLRPLCSSWEDLLWAYTRTSVDVRVEKEIRDNTIKEHQTLPDRYWNSFLTLEEIFNKLKATSELKAEADSAVRIVQELVCLDRSADLIQTMSNLLDGSDLEQVPEEIVRFMAHVVLILRMIGRSYPDNHANNIIRTYVKMLARNEDANLVAFYTSKLELEDQVEEYALFLEPVADVQAKLRCLDAASTHGLPLTDITHRVANIIWKRVNEIGDEYESLTKETTDSDVMRMDALDWMMFYSDQRPDALVETNTIVRAFISQGKVDAARRAHAKIPGDSVDVIMSQYNCHMDDKGCMQTDNLPSKVNSAITEYLAYKAYLDAHEGFSDWFKMLHSKPASAKLENLEQLSDLTKQVSIRESTRVINDKHLTWKATIDHVTKTVKAQLYNVLVFPPRGWLVDIFDSDSDQQRKTQLAALRSLCIPEVIALLHTLLHSMELYEDCLDLCTVVMSEEHQIYKVVGRQGLKDLMEKVSESCLELSCRSPDAFALPPPVQPATPLNISL